MRKYSELSGKLAAQPEIAALRAKAQEAHQAYQYALDSAISKEDPVLLARYKAAREEMMRGIRNPRSQKNASTQTPAPNGYGLVSTEEKRQLDAARREAMQSPLVKEAREKRNQAKTEEERSAAAIVYRAELHRAMIAADRDVESLLKRLENR